MFAVLGWNIWQCGGAYGHGQYSHSGEKSNIFKSFEQNGIERRYIVLVPTVCWGLNEAQKPTTSPNMLFWLQLSV